jgi:osmoprotectant transport system permease protein
MSALNEFLQQRGQEILISLGEHIYLVVFSMALAIVIAVPIGLILTRTKRIAGPVIAAVGIIQTLPGLALVGLLVVWLDPGPGAAITALTLYALLPIVRNTYTGVKAVDPAMIEAARGMGMTSGQILWKIEMPLSVPVIMAGVRTSTIICVGIATLGGIIDAGGLGELIWLGIDRSKDSLIIAGAVPAIGLALALDGILAVSQHAFTPRGLRVSTEETTAAPAGSEA